MGSGSASSARLHPRSDSASWSTTRPHTIVGIMPPGFRIEREEDEQVFLPLETETNRGHGYLRVLARLRPDITLAQARSDMDQIAARIERLYPRLHKGVGVFVMPMTEGLARNALAGQLTL